MSAKDIATGGLLTALTLVLLYLTLLIPTNTLTLLTLASFMSIVALLRQNKKVALLVYVSASLLSFIMLPLQTALLYFLFFGIYGLVKAFIEQLRHLLLEYLLKFIYFSLIFLILKELFIVLLPSVLISQNTLIVFGALQGAFFIYDYALTLLIDLYFKHFPS